MILRGYQEKIVKEVLESKENILCVAPTGAGKTIIIKSIIERSVDKKILLLQHTKELLKQNFDEVCFEEVTTIESSKKDLSGRIHVGMVISASKTDLPPYDYIIIDEAHHILSNVYLSILEKQPNAKIIGFTATPFRGDKKTLGKIFKKVIQVTYNELFKEKILVEPTFYAIDHERSKQIQDLKDHTFKGSEVNLNKAEETINWTPINRRVVEEYLKLSENRKTIVFCCSIEHAHDIADCFNNQGIKSLPYHSKLHMKKRNDIIEQFRNDQDFKVMTNVFSLTEGFNCPEISCVILLRPTSYKGTFIQMVGRGLRTHKDKQDCIVLDFGVSAEMYGDLKIPNKLEGSDKEQELKQHFCVHCKSITNSVEKLKVCPICSCEFQKECPKCMNLCELHEESCPSCAALFIRNKKQKKQIEDFLLKKLDFMSSLSSGNGWLDFYKDDQYVERLTILSFPGVNYRLLISISNERIRLLDLDSLSIKDCTSEWLDQIWKDTFVEDFFSHTQLQFKLTDKQKKYIAFLKSNRSKKYLKDIKKFNKDISTQGEAQCFIERLKNDNFFC